MVQVAFSIFGSKYAARLVSHGDVRTVMLTGWVNDGCVSRDPTEHHDLSKADPAKLAELTARFFQNNATAFLQARLAHAPAKCEQYAQAHYGYVGPYLY